MRENRTSGSEGGGAVKRLSLPLSGVTLESLTYAGDRAAYAVCIAATSAESPKRMRAAPVHRPSYL
jgi:hypothetical protein